GALGPTHYGLEDVGIMRVQPGITVIVPADAPQTRTALRDTWDVRGPVYYRIGRDETSVVPGLDARFQLGGITMTRRGSDILFLAMGGVAQQAALAADQLEGDGISAAVAVAATLSPSPSAALVRTLREFELVVTVEAHF